MYVGRVGRMSTSTQVLVLLPTERKKWPHFTVVLMNPCYPPAKLGRNVCSGSLFLDLVLLVGSSLSIPHLSSPQPSHPCPHTASCWGLAYRSSMALLRLSILAFLPGPCSGGWDEGVIGVCSANLDVLGSVSGYKKPGVEIKLSWGWKSVDPGFHWLLSSYIECSRRGAAGWGAASQGPQVHPIPGTVALLPFSLVWAHVTFERGIGIWAE